MKTFLVGFLALLGSVALAAEYDVLIVGGTVYDGSGAPGRQADVALAEGRIVKIGTLADASARRRIEAKGLAVAPGFIDLHAHIDPILQLPGCESAVRQGITTSLGGPDGTSPWPFSEYLADLDKVPLGMNVAYLVGQGSIRRAVLKLVDRPPTAAELKTMEGMVSQAMDDGAFGISTGLKYLPGAFTKTDEIVALSRIAAQKGGFYTSHLREEGEGLIPAVQEAIEIGRQAGIPIVLTHHKVVGKPSWGASVRTLKLVDDARSAGLDVSIDQYPYTASNTSISVLIPAWSMAGGREEFRKRMADPAQRKKAHAEIVNAIMTDRGAGDVARVQFATVAWKKDLEGRTLRDWCVERGLAPTAESGADLVIEAEGNGGCVCIFHAMDDADVERIMRHPQTMIASDGRLARLGADQPHPRAYGTFPRVLARYVREKKVLTLESAIFKMSGQPAQRMGLRDRGQLAEGMRADVVIFDPAKVSDEATFKDPHHYPKGIPFVFVNGVAVVDDGKFTDARPGKVLRRGK